MKFIKKAPLFLILLSTGILFTVIAVAGKDTIYKEQDFNPLKAPILSIVFTGIDDEIYPWQVMDESITKREEWLQVEEDESANMIAPTPTSVIIPSEKTEAQQESLPGAAQMPVLKGEKAPVREEVETHAPTETRKPLPEAAQMPVAAPTPKPTPYSIKNMRLAPLRESTREEYLNHTSADIYGNAGVIRAAAYEFAQVDETYFEDALFIGDSRTVGLHDYTDLRDHATFLCETSLTVYKVMDKEFKGKGTVEEVLAAGDYGKIYLMVGINELGVGTTEEYMARYTEVIDRIHELEPEAMIFIQGTMHVSGEKSKSDDIFNNQNIIARNNAIATLADNIQVFYIDVNEVVCDEEGNLNAEYTFDQIHLLGVYNDLWKQFLLNHGAVKGS